MKLFRSFITLGVVCFSQGFGQINEVNTMKEVETFFSQADRETLAIFDIDMVLIQPADPAFQMANMKRYSPICKKVVGQLPSEKKDIFLVLTTLNTDTVLIDAQMPSLLEELEKKKVPTMALTGNLTGKFGQTERMEQWKKERLKQVGIDFSRVKPYANPIQFKELPAYRGNYSLYEEGILFVNGSVCSKGGALIAFLKKTALKPRKIFFIDDREEHVKSVEAALAKNYPSIEFQGLHFTGAVAYPSEEVSEQQFEARWQEIAQLAHLAE